MATAWANEGRSDDWRHIGKARQSLNNVVADALREAILSGQFKPGDRLPEPQLAEMFGVSRNPIREALQVLSNEGIIEISPRKGARVPLLSEEELSETIELRAELEGISARNAARHCQGGVKKGLQDLLARGNDAQARYDQDELRRVNELFHVELAKAGKNRYLTEFMRSLRDRTYWLFSTQTSSRAEESWTEHAKILEAVIAGDEMRAMALAAEHVQMVGKALLDSMK